MPLLGSSSGWSSPEASIVRERWLIFSQSSRTSSYWCFWCGLRHSKGHSTACFISSRQIWRRFSRPRSGMRRWRKYFMRWASALAPSSCIRPTIASIIMFIGEKFISCHKEMLIDSWSPFRDCHIITTMDYLTSLLAGLIIFGILGHLSHVMGVDITDVTKSYMGLAFIAYPETIAKFEFIPQFFSFAFFFMLFLFCIGSNMGMTSCITTVIRDKYPTVKCWKIVVVIVVFGSLVGCVYSTPGGQFIINLVDFYGASFVALVFAIVELMTVSWVYGVDRFCRDVEFMLGRRTGIYWRFCWKFVTPTIMISIFVYFVLTWQPITYHDLEYSPNLTLLGWSIAAFALFQLPLWAFVAFLKQKHGSLKIVSLEIAFFLNFFFMILKFSEIFQCIPTCWKLGTKWCRYQ